MKKFIFLIIVLALGFYIGWPAFSGYQINNALKAGDAGALSQKIDFTSVRRSMREPIMTKIEGRIAQVMKELGPAAALLGQGLKRENIVSVVDGALADVINPKQLIGVYANGGDLTGAIQEAMLRQIDKMGGLTGLLGGGKKSASAGGGNKSAIKMPGGMQLPGPFAAMLGSKQGQDFMGKMMGNSGFNAEKIKKMLFPKKTAKMRAAGKANKGKESFGLSNIKKFGFTGPLALQLGVARTGTAKNPDVTAEMSFTDFDWKLTKLIPNLSSF